MTGASEETAGARVPSITRRVWFAVFIAAVAALFAAMRIRVMPGASDFAPVWYGARSLLHGVNPYSTFGPGLGFHYDWHLYYPGTALLAAAPFGLLSEPSTDLVMV